MRASLIQVNLVIVTVDVDDNTWLVRFLHGIHLLVIIGPQNWGDFPSANNKEILQPYILIRTSTNPTSQTALYCSAQHPITIHRHNETRIHTGYMASYCVAVSVCHSVGVDGCWWHFCRKKCICTRRYDAARFLITSQTKSDLTARTDGEIIPYSVRKVKCRLCIRRSTGLRVAFHIFQQERVVLPTGQPLGWFSISQRRRFLGGWR